METSGELFCTSGSHFRQQPNNQSSNRGTNESTKSIEGPAECAERLNPPHHSGVLDVCMNSNALPPEEVYLLPPPPPAPRIPPGCTLDGPRTAPVSARESPLSYLGAVLGASWSLLACLARFLRLSCAIPIDLGRISAALGPILDDLGSILLDLASIWGPSGDRF